MSDELTHASVGDVIARVVAKVPDGRISTPFVAACMAFASHVGMDIVDNDYTLDPTGWSRDAYLLETQMPILANQISGLGMELYGILTDNNNKRRDIRLAALLGSILPDVIDGVYAYLHPDLWQSGKMLFPWHQAGMSLGPMQTAESARKRTGFLNLLQVSFAVNVGSWFRRKKVSK
jgi:hypothetical protein